MAEAVAAYSTRARPEGTLSFPLGWRDLKATGTRPLVTVESVVAKLKRRADPWKDYWACRQTLSATGR